MPPARGGPQNAAGNKISFGQAAVRRSNSIEKDRFITKVSRVVPSLGSSRYISPFLAGGISADDPNNHDVSAETSAYSLPQPPPIRANSDGSGSHDIPFMQRHCSPLATTQSVSSSDHFDSAYHSGHFDSVAQQCQQYQRRKSGEIGPLESSADDFVSATSSVGGTRNSYDDTTVGDVSGVDLTFTPEDDVSTIGYSVVSEAQSGKDPEGHKSDDALLYSPPSDIDPSTSKEKSKKKKKASEVQSEKRELLTTVDEHSQDIEAPAQTQNAAERIVDKIMNRPNRPLKEEEDSDSESSSEGRESGWTSEDDPSTVNHGESDDVVNETLQRMHE